MFVLLRSEHKEYNRNDFYTVLDPDKAALRLDSLYLWV